MPIHLHYDPSKGILVGTVTDPITPESFAASMAEIRESDTYPPDVPTLWDLREVDFDVVDQPFLRALIELRERFPERGTAKIAALATDDLTYGIARMYEMLSAGLPQRMMVFRSKEEAERWLLE